MKISVILEMLTANFETDTKRAEKAFAKSVKGIEDTAKKAGVAAGAAFASAALAMGALAKQAIDTADKINESTQRTGLAAEQISKLKYAAEQSGSSLSTVEKGLQRLSKEADSGGKNLARLGISAVDASGKARPLNDLFLDAADKISKMGNATERSAAAQAVFGKAGVELLPILRSGREGIEALGKEAEQLGVVFSGDMVAASEAFNDNLDKLKSAALGLGNSLATELLPHLLNLTEAAINFVKQIREDGTLQAWGEALKTAAGYVDELAVFIATRLVAGALVGLYAGLVKVTGATTAATIASNAFRLALALLGGPVGLLLTGVAALAVAIYSQEDALDDARVASVRLVEASEQLKVAQGAGIKPMLEATIAAREEAAAKLKLAQADLAAAQARTELNAAVVESLRSGPRGEPGAQAAVGGAAIAQNVNLARIEELRTVVKKLEGDMDSSAAAVDAARQRLAEYEASVAAANAPTVELGKNAEALASDQKDLADASKLAEDAQKALTEAWRKGAEEAYQASQDLNAILDQQAATLGGPGVSAALDYRDVLKKIYDLEILMLAAGPQSEETTLRLAQARAQAAQIYQDDLDEQARSEADRVRQSGENAEDYERAWANANQAIIDSFADLFSGGIRSMEDFGDEMLRIAQRMVSDILREFARTGEIKIGPGMFGQGGTGFTLQGAASALGMAYGGYQNARNGGSPLATVGSFAMSGAQIAGPTGAIVGAIVGAITAAFASQNETILRVRSTQFNGDRQARGVASSDLGEIFVRGETLGAGAAAQIAEGIKEFDDAIAGLLDDDQLAAVRQRLENVNDTFRDGAATIGEALDARFSAILGELSEDVIAFVGTAGDLEDRVGRLAEALQIEMIVGLGTLGDTFSEVSGYLEEYRQGTEDLAVTYDRLIAGADLFEAALGMAGVAFSGTRLELVEFAADVVEAAGGLDRASALWNAYFERFYTEAERAQYTLGQATSNASERFSGIGLDLGDYSGAGGMAAFRDLFESTLPTLSAEAAAQWLEAAAALGLMVELTGEATGQVVDLTEALRAYETFVSQFAVDSTPPTGADATSLSEAQAQVDAWEATMVASANAYARAAGMEGAAAEDLANIHATAAGHVAAAGARLEEAYQGFVGQFRPDTTPATGADAQTVADAIAQAALWEAAMVASANAYAVAAGREGAAAEDLANIHTAAAGNIAQATARLEQAYQSFVAQFRPEAISTGADAGSVADAIAQAEAWERSMVEQANAYAVAAGRQGAAAEDLANIHNAAAGHIASATQRLRAAYDQFVEQFALDLTPPTGAEAGTLAEAQSQAETWEAYMVAQANALAIAAGMQGAAMEDLANIHLAAADFVVQASRRIADATAEAAARQSAAAAELSGFVANLAAQAAGGVTPLTSQLQQLNAQYQSNIETIQRLARESGRAGASTAELAAATGAYRQQVQALVQQLVASARSLISRLQVGIGAFSTGSGGSTGGSAVGGGEVGAVSDVQAAVEDRYARELQLLGQISEYVDSLNLSALSPLTPQERVDEARAAFESLLGRAQSGDLDALEQLRSASQDYLGELQDFTGGVGGYRGEFERVRAALAAIVERGPLSTPLPATAPGGGGGGGGGGPVTVEAGASFQELSALERAALAQELTVVLRDLIAASQDSLVEVSTQLGLDLVGFVRALGVDLNAMTLDTTRQLAEISRSLGVDLAELASAVGFELGELGDAQSLLNDALESAIAGLPADIRDQLAFHLRAIEAATIAGDPTAAVGAMEEAIRGFGPDVAALLAPFLGGVDSPTDSLLDVTVAQADNIAAIRGILEAGVVPGTVLTPGPGLGGGGIGPVPPSPGALVEGKMSPVESAEVVDLSKYREENAALRREVREMKTSQSKVEALLTEANEISRDIARKVSMPTTRRN